jgi:hypothetical protein
MKPKSRRKTSEAPEKEKGYRRPEEQPEGTSSTSRRPSQGRGSAAKDILGAERSDRESGRPTSSRTTTQSGCRRAGPTLSRASPAVSRRAVGISERLRARRQPLARASLEKIAAVEAFLPGPRHVRPLGCIRGVQWGTEFRATLRSVPFG